MSENLRIPGIINDLDRAEILDVLPAMDLQGKRKCTSADLEIIIKNDQK